MTKHVSHWIGGKAWDGAAERRGDIYNPATGQVTGTVDFASATVVGEVRGKGLMFAVDLVDPGTGAPSPALATRALEEARERGLLIGKGGLYGHALRMAPPMNITEAEAKEGVGLLIDALRAVDEGARR